jgi:hypothetical protein
MTKKIAHKAILIYPKFRGTVHLYSDENMLKIWYPALRELRVSKMTL